MPYRTADSSILSHRPPLRQTTSHKSPIHKSHKNCIGEQNSFHLREKSRGKGANSTGGRKLAAYAKNFLRDVLQHIRVDHYDETYTANGRE